jgi:hypothetical protein
MKTIDEVLRQAARTSRSRLDFWVEFILAANIHNVAEIGVYRGDFAAHILGRCDGIRKYYMLDSWRHLDGWNKPANERDDELFEQYLAETKRKTEFAAEKRIVLRGKTTEVIDSIADGALDLAYIDADHTLKGISIDLMRVYPKVRVGGFVCGDDFTATVWQHPTRFEPTLVFPFAVYFAEAVGARIYGLPHSQFLIDKSDPKAFEFVDLTGNYPDTSLLNQFKPRTLLKLTVKERFPRLTRVVRRATGFFAG